jgi:microcystin synthetase protein McyB
VLSRYSGSLDVVFGVTVAVSPADLGEVERRIGLYINTLPLRVRIEPRETVLTLLQELQRRQGELIEYQYSSLADVQRWAAPAGGAALFETEFIFENYPVEMPEAAAMNRLIRMTGLGAIDRTHQALTLEVGARGSLVVKAMYDAERFEGPAIERLLGHLEVLLTDIITDPSQLSARLLAAGSPAGSLAAASN